MNVTENLTEYYDYDSDCNETSWVFTSGSVLIPVLYYMLFCVGLIGKITHTKVTCKTEYDILDRHIFLIWIV